MPGEIQNLIRNMSSANPRWGAPCIHGELQKLGINLAQATVAKYMVPHRKPPSQTWRTFLKNHAKDLVSTDFFVVPTATFRLLFVFLVLSHDRRRLIHFGVTSHPTAEWTARQLVSLDTLRPDRFLVLTRRDAHTPVLRGIEAARQAGFRALKIDAVVVRGANEDELADLIEFGKGAGAEVRFIEYMDVGGATQWSRSKVVSRAEILDALSRRYGRIAPVGEGSSAPAEWFLLADGTVFGIIASTTTPFCRRCDRSRLTADGIWYLCLYAEEGTDLRKSLRGGATREEIKSLIVSQWAKRTDRGAEERKDLPSRGMLVGIQQLRQDPHLEMHTRGG